MSAIDIHAHLVPPGLLDDLAAGRLRFPGIEVVDSDKGRSLAFAGGEPTRPVPGPMQDVERRFAWMGEQGLERQVVAGWLDVFGYELPAAEGAEWARTLSERLRAEAEADERLFALGTLPMQDPGLAAGALRELVEAGFPGVMIATRIGDRELDEEAFIPFWEAADELGAVIYLHPSFGSPPRHRSHGLVNGLARLEDTTVTLARLLYAGVPARFPGAKIVASHGGGSLPYVLGRLARNQAKIATDAADPHESFTRLYYDTVVFDPAALRLLVEQAGAGQVLLGSDYPFPIGDLEPRGVVEAAGFDAETVERILSGNAAQLLGIGARAT